jgi:hypothetical protein
MAFVLADRVKDTTTTTGTGTITLSGTAPTGYQTFGSAIGNGNNTYYTITAGSEWEVGIGTYTSAGTTLSRTTVLSSSAAGSLVTFSAGTKDVFVTYPATKSINLDTTGGVTIGSSLLTLSSTGVVTSPNLADAVGYKNIPQNAQNGAYPVVATDGGKHIYSTNSCAQTISVPTNAGTPLPNGFTFTVVNNGTTAITFTTTSLTVYKAGTSTAWASGGTLAVRGLATWLKVGTDTWFVSGSGLS